MCAPDKQKTQDGVTSCVLAQFLKSRGEGASVQIKRYNTTLVAENLLLPPYAEPLVTSHDHETLYLVLGNGYTAF